MLCREQYPIQELNEGQSILEVLCDEIYRAAHVPARDTLWVNLRRDELAHLCIERGRAAT